MDDRTTTFEELKERIRAFVKARDWEKFHSPKNLSMSLAIEAAELMELFQWTTTEGSKIIHLKKGFKKKVEEEMADIAIYLLNLCNVLDVDLSGAIIDKLRASARKYPIELAKGKAHKYTAYQKRHRNG